MGFDRVRGIERRGSFGSSTWGGVFERSPPMATRPCAIPSAARSATTTTTRTVGIVQPGLVRSRRRAACAWTRASAATNAATRARMDRIRRTITRARHHFARHQHSARHRGRRVVRRCPVAVAIACSSRISPRRARSSVRSATPTIRRAGERRAIRRTWSGGARASRPAWSCCKEHADNTFITGETFDPIPWTGRSPAVSGIALRPSHARRRHRRRCGSTASSATRSKAIRAVRSETRLRRRHRVVSQSEDLRRLVPARHRTTDAAEGGRRCAAARARASSRRRRSRLRSRTIPA